jgi:YD repeat-containing protein
VQDSSGATITTYTYSEKDRRISKTTSSGTIYYHYADCGCDQSKVLYETDENNNIVAEYTYDQQGHPITMTKGGNTYYYNLNGHGDIVALTDESGTVVAEYQYDAWVNIISQSSTMAMTTRIGMPGIVMTRKLDCITLELVTMIRI